MPRLDEEADECASLVGGYATGYAEDYIHALFLFICLSR